jgi:hypothetical protein
VSEDRYLSPDEILADEIERTTAHLALMQRAQASISVSKEQAAALAAERKRREEVERAALNLLNALAVTDVPTSDGLVNATVELSTLLRRHGK